MRYSIDIRDGIHVKDYGFLSILAIRINVLQL